jgi:hypothetical protein
MEGEGYVLKDCLIWEEAKILKNGSNLAAQFWDFVGSESIQILARNMDRASSRALFTKDQTEEGRLTRARESYEENKLTLDHFDIDAI